MVSWLRVRSNRHNDRLSLVWQTLSSSVSEKRCLSCCLVYEQGYLLPCQSSCTVSLPWYSWQRKHQEVWAIERFFWAESYHRLIDLIDLVTTCYWLEIDRLMIQLRPTTCYWLEIDDTTPPNNMLLTRDRLIDDTTPPKKTFDRSNLLVLPLPLFPPYAPLIDLQSPIDSLRDRPVLWSLAILLPEACLRLVQYDFMVSAIWLCS